MSRLPTPGSAASYWISMVASTQFTSNVNVAPGGSGIELLFSKSFPL